ncbi:MAG: VWA domain-containing protein, partial [Planctomycetaceae bacterium]|nr:VWA domain-containing protein [Planctomycetaceae bacterium]
TRLAQAQQRVLELIDQMGSDDVAMVISFADTSQVAQSFTHNRQELRRAVEQLRVTDRPTSIIEALRAAAGLANPGRSSQDATDIQVADALPAKLFVLSDGKFPDVSEFSLGNLEPTFLSIGDADSGNVALTALGVSRRENRPEQRQVFARIENLAKTPFRGELTLSQEANLLDAQAIELEPDAGRGITFDLPDELRGSIELKLTTREGINQLALDDRAFLALDEPRRASVLVVTPGNEPLQVALSTLRTNELADVRFEKTEYLANAAYRTLASSGRLDLVVFDRCAPAEMPQANTWFIGAMPPGSAWNKQDKAVAPQILDADTSHPLMQLVEMSDVLIAEATPLVPPKPQRVLLESTAGTLLAIAPREAFEDVVQGFELVGNDSIGTNWPVRLSFPVFVMNVLEYFGPSREQRAVENVRPGAVVALPVEAETERVVVTNPAGERTELVRDRRDQLHYSLTDRIGVYRIESGDQQRQFAVNLLDPAESDIRPRAEKSIQLGYTKVVGEQKWQAGRRELWKWLASAALVLVVIEWYVYNQRLNY